MYLILPLLNITGFFSTVNSLVPQEKKTQITKWFLEKKCQENWFVTGTIFNVLLVRS